MRSVYMLIGLPGSGKSTFTKNFFTNKNVVVLSTDNYILNNFKKMGYQSYKEAFPLMFKDAKKNLHEELEAAVRNPNVLQIVWDQTNLTAKSRKRKMDLLGRDKFDFFGVVFESNEEDSYEDNNKGLSRETVVNLSSIYKPPSIEEGYRAIWKVEKPKDEPYEEMEFQRYSAWDSPYMQRRMMF